MSLRPTSLLLLFALLLVCIAHLALLQGTVLLPQSATQLAQTLAPLLGLAELLCLRLALHLQLCLGAHRGVTCRLISQGIWALLLVELGALYPGSGQILLHLLGSLGELLLLALLAGCGLRLPQTRAHPQQLRMLFQGIQLLVVLHLGSLFWLAHTEAGHWLHLPSCDLPLCTSLLTGLRILPLLLLASGLFHCSQLSRHCARLEQC